MKIDLKEFKWKEQYTYCVLCILAVCMLFVVSLSQKKDEKNHPNKAEKIQAGEETEDNKEQEKEIVSENPTIRVLIRGNGFVDEVHPAVILQAAGAMVISGGEQQSESAPGEAVTFAPDHPWFAGGPIRITPKEPGDTLSVLSLERGNGTPSYRGTLELIATAEGLAVINELPLEEYLCGVVPSEMPSSYEMEALKCQAVCARSYAYNQMKEIAYPEYQAHVDDSTAFQVYGNSGEAESASQAVKETEGKKLLYQGQVATAYYYSTSCGRTTDMTAWGSEVNEGNAYLSSVSVAGPEGDYERGLPWYKWDAVIDKAEMGNLISLNTKVQIGQLVNLEVTRRGAGDVALQIVASGTLGSVTVDTENKIRRALGGSSYQLVKQDGTAVQGKELLPSAFFTVEDQGGAIALHGGGFGHGIGMSQNGANEMAKQGMSCEEILKVFYTGIEIG